MAWNEVRFDGGSTLWPSLPSTSEASPGTDPWEEPTETLFEPTVRGRESVPPEVTEVRPSRIVEGRSRGWWSARMAWGDLDLREPGLLRFGPGVARPTLEREFVLGALDRLG